METEKIADTNRVKDIKNITQTLDFMFKNSELLYLYKRTEKLSLAIHLITDFFSHENSIKWHLRSNSVALLSFIISPEKDTRIPPKETVYYLLGLIRKILSFLELALHLRLISTMNYSILSQEYVKLGKEIKMYIEEESLVEDFLFPEHFFVPPGKDRQPHKKTDARKIRTNIHKGQNWFNGTSYKGQPLSADGRRMSNRRATKVERQNTIVQILRAKGEISIRDISGTIKDCSEKTIQRELMSLIGQGMVERRGRRRWSTYVLKELPLG